MNKNRISKLFHISTTSNKQETAADIILKSHMYLDTNLGLDYLVNFQNLNLTKMRSGMEYIQYYGLKDDSVEDEECAYIEIEESEERLKNISLLFELRKSYRKFQREIKKEELFTLLSFTLKEKKNEKGESRRNYPSGGALYPIKLFMYIFGVNEIKDGVYLYEHKKNRLIYYDAIFDKGCMEEVLKGQSISFEQSGILIMYVYDFLQNYIKYHDIALSLAFIEVGAISQTIQLVAPQCGMGYCDIGGFPKGKIEKWLNLNSPYFHIVHVGVMGGVKNEI